MCVCIVVYPCICLYILVYACISLYIIVYHCISLYMLYILVYHCISLYIIVYPCISLYILVYAVYPCRFRVWCYKLVKAKSFQTITFTVIFISSIILALETPLPVTSQLFCSIQQTIVFFDVFFLIWFIFEFTLKVSK